MRCGRAGIDRRRVQVISLSDIFISPLEDMYVGEYTLAGLRADRMLKRRQ